MVILYVRCISILVTDFYLWAPSLLIIDNKFVFDTLTTLLEVSFCTTSAWTPDTIAHFDLWMAIIQMGKGL